MHDRIHAQSRDERVLNVFASVAPTILLDVFPSSACINATWVLAHVLWEYGILVRPLAVTAFAVNRAFLNKMHEHQRGPQEGELEDWYRQNGAHSVGIIRDRQLKEDSWVGGHLVGMVNDVLVDPTAYQLARRHHHILLPTVLLTRVSDDFLSGGKRHVLTLKGGGGLSYEAFPEDRSYRETPGWVKGIGNQGAADRILKQMKLFAIK
jgi:hypothetical protein